MKIREIENELEGINNILRLQDKVLELLDSDFEKLTDEVARSGQNNGREIKQLLKRLSKLENRLDFFSGGEVAPEEILNDVKRRVTEMLESTESKLRHSNTQNDSAMGYADALRVVLIIMDDY